MEPFHIRAMTPDDIPKLVDIRPGFTSDLVLRLEKTGQDYQVGWCLIETKLDQPYDKGQNYDFDTYEQRNIAERLAQANSLEEVIIDTRTDKIVGVLDVATESWRSVAWIWNIMLDKDIRGRGLGRILMERTITWAKSHNLRAVMLETQSNNVPACQFYAHLGFQLVGINDQFYTNHDIKRDEIALFWSYPLKP